MQKFILPCNIYAGIICGVGFIDGTDDECFATNLHSHFAPQKIGTCI